ncbi:MAG: transcriptional repressor, partial [Lachnospiraceae bacterium]|nr:transcriptional repressor [Lachnospiraceae bacterium]
REHGCRITKHRLLLLDIILSEECSCSKEIYYKASAIDDSIGSATVYRMINTLEEIGAIDRRNMYRIDCGRDCAKEFGCKVELEDDTVIEFSGSKWNQIVTAGLKACGYLNGKEVRSVVANV